MKNSLKFYVPFVYPFVKPDNLANLLLIWMCFLKC